MTLFATDQRLQEYRIAAVIHPFAPKAPVSADSSHQQREPPFTLASRRKVVEGPGHRATGPTKGAQSINPQQPRTEQDSSKSGETSTLGDDSRYRAIQAQIRLLMQRVERIEGVEEAPPEYVSAYGSSR
ncbi:hypothetical protein PM082_014738 [Marasmius tenuissimus]|nr:hypothetical protein PM082_014738 [Marasmius tenuissimus]